MVSLIGQVFRVSSLLLMRVRHPLVVVETKGQRYQVVIAIKKTAIVSEAH
jgi:hypothetical protein